MRTLTEKPNDWKLYQHRVLFLRAMEDCPQADDVWWRLATRARTIPNDRQMLVQEWAVEARLAKAPMGDSWIVRTAVEWLRRMESDPYPEVRLTEDQTADTESIEHWGRYSSCVPPVYVRFDEVFRFDPFEPDSMIEEEYASVWAGNFRRALKEHIGSQQALQRLDMRNHTWLVAYHFAGAEYGSLPAMTRDKMDEDSVKTTLSKLRAILQLPMHAKPGRRKEKRLTGILR